MTRCSTLFGALQFSLLCFCSFSLLAAPDEKVIYRLHTDGTLYAYQFLGLETGEKQWGKSQAVGAGWNIYNRVFSASGGYVYGIDAKGNLYWYRHDGQHDRSKSWTGRKLVGTGWHFKTVFAAGNGVIYAINRDNDLLWYRHDGQADGTKRWTGAKKVGAGWGGFTKVFPGDDGSIYAVDTSGALWWYQHQGQSDGTAKWRRTKVASGWQIYTQLSAAPGGVIYALKPNGELLWYRHLGYQDGSDKWQGPKAIGTGWLNNPIVVSAGADRGQAVIVTSQSVPGVVQDAVVVLPSSTQTSFQTFTGKIDPKYLIYGSLTEATRDIVPDSNDKAQMAIYLLGHEEGARLANYGAVIDELIRLNNAQFDPCNTRACTLLKLGALRVLLVQKILTLAKTDPATWTGDQRNLMELMRKRQQELRDSYTYYLRKHWNKAKVYPCTYDYNQTGCTSQNMYRTLLQGAPTITPDSVKKIIAMADSDYEDEFQKRLNGKEIAETAAFGLLLDAGLKMVQDPKKIENIPPEELTRLIAATAIVKQYQTAIIEFNKAYASSGAELGEGAKARLASLSVAEGALTIANAAISLNTLSKKDLTDAKKAELGLAIVSGSTSIISGAASLAEGAIAVGTGSATSVSTTATRVTGVAQKVGGIAGVAGGVAGLATGILAIVEGADSGNNTSVATGAISLVSGTASVVSGVAATAQAFGAMSTVASTASAISGPVNILALAATIGTVEGARVFGNIDAEKSLNGLVGESGQKLDLTAFLKNINSEKGKGMIPALASIKAPPPAKPTLPVFEVWVGEAPACEGEPADCTKIYLKFIKEDSKGDGNACWSGKKVLCRSY